MTPERLRQITALFHDALARDAEARTPFLDEACAGDRTLHREVMALLEAHHNAGPFGEIPLFERLRDTAEVSSDYGSSDAGTAFEMVEPGLTFAGYRVERLLGRGGMGAVYLAYDTTLRRRVALKVVGAPSHGETAAAHVLREARNAAALNHPGICTIHDVGGANGSAFIAMEYVDGRPLSDRLGDGALPLEDTARYAIQAADALGYAHDNGVVHRDFKAANVMVTAGGWVKIVDFGLARRTDTLIASASTVESLAPLGVAAGTPYAMAPEQVRGAGTDARTDIWALGVLLYEMVSGARPFSASTVPELFSSILRDAPAPLPNGVPADLRSVIERCLEKEPARRYQHAREVRAAIEAIEAGTMPPWATWRAPVRRHPWAAMAAAGLTAVTLLLAVNAGGVRERITGSPPAAEPIKLAVLPFENLTGDPEQEYFSDGLTDEMITQLGRLHPQRLSVIARTSSMRYKNREMPIDQIGRELGVDYVLEGSARREGTRVRINATLVQVRGQTQRWSDSFDREIAGILTLQSDIARGVAGSLALTLLPAEETRLASARPINPEAYEAYLRGHSHAIKLAPADLETALKYFGLALEKDSNSALAYAGIALVWSIRQQMGFVPPGEAAPPLKAAATKALELDSTLPEVHFRLAVQYAWTDWDWTAAESAFRRALELNPNYGEARAFYSHYLQIMQRPAEAMVQIQRALQLDPFSDLIQTLYAVNLQIARRFEEAIVQHRNALRTASNSPLALRGLARSLEAVGRHDEALAAEKAYQAARGDRETIEALDRGHTEGSYRGALRRAADTLAGRPRASAIDVAVLYLRADENERALTWLEHAYDAHHPDLPYAAALPWYDKVRGDPRFQNLLRRMNLPM